LEKELIIKARKGDVKALELLYKQFYGYALGIALRYSSSKEEASEVVNDGFMKVFDKLHLYQDNSSFKAWLRKIMVNTAIDYYRRNKKYSSMMDIEMAYTESFSPEIFDRLSVEDILKALNQLPDLLKMVFNLYEIEGYSHKEISDQLYIPESSSRTYLARAKQKLRVLICELNRMTDEKASI
jgi:RNA polymerase sigma factor (sigma-70 family)